MLDLILSEDFEASLGDLSAVQAIGDQTVVELHRLSVRVAD